MYPKFFKNLIKLNILAIIKYKCLKVSEKYSKFKIKSSCIQNTNNNNVVLYVITCLLISYTRRYIVIIIITRRF